MNTDSCTTCVIEETFSLNCKWQIDTALPIFTPYSSILFFFSFLIMIRLSLSNKHDQLYVATLQMDSKVIPYALSSIMFLDDYSSHEVAGKSESSKYLSEHAEGLYLMRISSALP